MFWRLLVAGFINNHDNIMTRIFYYLADWIRNGFPSFVVYQYNNKINNLL